MDHSEPLIEGTDPFTSEVAMPAPGGPRIRPRATAERQLAAPPVVPQRAPALLRLFDGAPWLGLRILSDFVVLAAACAIATRIDPAAGIDPLLALFPPLTLLCLDSGGRYRQRMRDAALDSAGAGFGAISISAMTIFALQVLTGAQTPGGPVLAWTWLVSIVAVTSVAMALTAIQRNARRRGLIRRRTLIVGTDPTGLEMAARLRRLPEYGLEPIGFLDARRALPHPPGALPLLGRLGDLAEVTRRHGVSHVIVCFPAGSHHDTLTLVAGCDELGLETTVVPRLSAAVNHQTRFEYLGTQPLLNLRAVDRESWRFMVKHVVDRIAAAVLLVVLAPLMGFIALGVKFSSPGPVLFRQRRAGRDGQLFELLKFRTMIEQDDAQAYELYPELAPRGIAPGGVEGIDRRTRLGKLLRGTSLDELPQLVNVLRGEMSLIGPRPERPEFAEMFRHEIERYNERHRVRSGITGWAQVHGMRGQTPLADRVELDNFYIEQWSLALDLKILLLTVPALLRGS
jgi:exopolysaccharide biosynthesis polyprenyl glycosylphosphotransferase